MSWTSGSVPSLSAVGLPKVNDHAEAPGPKMQPHASNAQASGCTSTSSYSEDVPGRERGAAECHDEALRTGGATT